MPYFEHDIEVDTHVHTMLSGHSWSTFGENVEQAAAIGLKGFCLTEHSCHVPNSPPEWLPYNELMLPESYKGVRCYRGLEADITDISGTVVPRESYLSMLEFVICSIHTFFSDEGTTAAEWTEAYINAMDNPAVDIMGHIDRLPCDMEAVVKAAKRKDKLIEINRGSLSKYNKKGRARLLELAVLCKRNDMCVCVGTDAHLHLSVGDFAPVYPLLEEAEFPQELIVNYELARFEKYVSGRMDVRGNRDPKRFG